MTKTDLKDVREYTQKWAERSEDASREAMSEISDSRDAEYKKSLRNDFRGLSLDDIVLEWKPKMAMWRVGIPRWNHYVGEHALAGGIFDVAIIALEDAV